MCCIFTCELNAFSDTDTISSPKQLSYSSCFGELIVVHAAVIIKLLHPEMWLNVGREAVLFLEQLGESKC